jgi:hypothetical protein
MDSCLLWCEVWYILIGSCWLFKSPYCIKNKERNFLWNSIYVYQTTGRQKSEGMNLCCQLPRQNLMSHHPLEFHFYLFLLYLLISFFSALFPFYCLSSFFSNEPLKNDKFFAVHVSNFTWRLRQKKPNEI